MTETSAWCWWRTPWGTFLFWYTLSGPLPLTTQAITLLTRVHRGFVASDTLFRVLEERAAAVGSTSGSTDENGAVPFPLIQGILTFDTPFNGLARSMFVYGAFSNYSKVSGVFNAMTALSAAAPASLSRLRGRSAPSLPGTSPSPSPSSPSGPGNPIAWTTWQIVAARTGTIGAIAAGGVAAYMHREAIIKGVRGIKNLSKEDVVESYHQSVGALGQGLAYINRGNVGKSFAWLSDHFTFVGALMKQNELNRRLDRMAAIKGVGIHDFYCSLGENGYWSGGYFVPERTFCAVPGEEHPAHGIFGRQVMRESADEVKAHLNIFKPEKHRGYDGMAEESAALVKGWFLSEVPVVDDPNLRKAEPEEKAEDKAVEKALESGQHKGGEEDPKETEGKLNEAVAGAELPDESPIDIAAAASMVPLPGSEADLTEPGPASEADVEAKKTYMQHLFQVAQQAGTGVKGWWPEKMPGVGMPSMPSMPSVKMPGVPSAVTSSLGHMSVPRVPGFGRKRDGGDGGGADGEKDGEANAAASDGNDDSERKCIDGKEGGDENGMAAEKGAALGDARGEGEGAESSK